MGPKSKRKGEAGIAVLAVIVGLIIAGSTSFVMINEDKGTVKISFENKESESAHPEHKSDEEINHETEIITIQKTQNHQSDIAKKEINSASKEKSEKQSSTKNYLRSKDSTSNNKKNTENSHDIQSFDSKSGFVYTNRTEFYINGKPFRFTGTNNYYLRYGSKDCIGYDPDGGCTREVLDDAQAMNITVIRTWGFTDGYYYWGSMQPELGVYDEENFRKLDYVIKEASERNIKLIIPFVNNWDEYGGICQYSRWCNITESNLCDPMAKSGPAAESHDAFYTDECARNAYKDFVEHIVTRVNSYTGIRYSEDPAIFSWELGNELRAESKSSGDATTKWVDEMSSFIKSLDSNHMVTTGMEGFYSGNSGTDFIDAHSISTIDFATVHLYPDYWGFSLDDSLSWISSHVDSAHNTIGKPVIIEEYGKMGSEKEDHLIAFHQKMIDSGSNGNLFWQLIDSRYIWDDGFGVYYPENESVVSIMESIISHWREYNILASPSNNPPEINAETSITVYEGSPAVIEFSSSDPDGDYVSISINDAYRFERINSSFVWNTKYNDRGNYTITITASDGISETSRTVSVNVEPAESCITPENNGVITKSGVICYGAYNLSDGIRLGENTHLDCNGSRLIGNGSSGILISGSGSSVKNCSISGYIYGIQMIKANNTGIYSNIIDAIGYNTYHGINIRQSENTSIKGNIFQNAADIGLYCYMSKNMNIHENEFKYNGKGIYFDGCSDNIIDSNNFSGNKGGGTLILAGSGGASSRNIIKNNTFNYDGMSWYDKGGIHINLGTGNHVLNNTLKRCYKGITVDSSSYNKIRGNKITGTFYFRSGLEAKSGYGNYFAENSVSGQYYGIKLSDSAGIEIKNNSIYNNTYSAFALSGDYNLSLNWFGSLYCHEIEESILDFDENSTFGRIHFNPILSRESVVMQCISDSYPGNAENLSVISISHNQIIWGWQNPADPDFSHAIVYLNGINVINTTQESYSATGLQPDTAYTLKIHTSDIAGNINSLDVSNTSTTNSVPDTTPPGPATNLRETALSHNSIVWEWANPEDSDFDVAIVYLDGVEAVQTAGNTYTASGLTADTSYTLSVKTKDASGNINNNAVVDTAITDSVPDTAPPASVTGLDIVSKGTDFIEWSWTNPSDADFSSAIVYIDNVETARTASGTYTAEGFHPETSHTISVKTIDISGNINENAVSRTDTTSEDIKNLPDISVQNISVYTRNPSSGEWTTFRIILKNKGTKSAEAASWIFESTGGIRSIVSDTFSINPGETIEAFPSVKYAQSGTFRARAVVDYSDSIDELDESNNEKETSVYVR